MGNERVEAEVFECEVVLCLKELVNGDVLCVFLYELCAIDAGEFSIDMCLSYSDCCGVKWECCL